MVDLWLQAALVLPLPVARPPATATMAPMDSFTNPVHLSVSLVVFHSDVLRLLQTVNSLGTAVAHARAEGQLGAVSLNLVDNSEDERYAAQVLECVGEVVAGWPQSDFNFAGAEKNLGYGSAHNLAATAVTSELHLVLNPDVDLAEDCLTHGIEDFAAHRGAVLLAPRVFSGRGEQEFLCRRYPSVLVLVLRAFAPRFIQSRFARQLAEYEMHDTCSLEQRAPVPLASGCFMLLRTEVFHKIGGFDDRFFLYFEDYDLCLRLAVEGDLMYQPTMNIVHHGGYAARKGVSHVGMFIRSGLQFFRQYGWRWI